MEAKVIIKKVCDGVVLVGKVIIAVIAVAMMAEFVLGVNILGPSPRVPRMAPRHATRHVPTHRTPTIAELSGLVECNTNEQGCTRIQFADNSRGYYMGEDLWLAMTEFEGDPFNGTFFAKDPEGGSTLVYVRNLQEDFKPGSRLCLHNGNRQPPFCPGQ